MPKELLPCYCQEHCIEERDGMTILAHQFCRKEHNEIRRHQFERLGEAAANTIVKAIGLDPNDPFEAILSEMRAMHHKKSADYGTGADPFANIRASEEFGIPAWLGAVVRQNDKMTRIKSFATKGELANESIEDSLLDNCVYAVIALLLYRQANLGAD